MAKVQFATVLRTRRGEEIEEPDPKGMPDEAAREFVALAERTQAPRQVVELIKQLTYPKVKLTLGELCGRALDAVFEDERKLSVKELRDRGELLSRIEAAEKAMTPLDLKPEEATKLQELIAKGGFSRALSSQAIGLLDGMSDPAPAAAANTGDGGPEAQSG